MFDKDYKKSPYLTGRLFYAIHIQFLYILLHWVISEV